MVAVMQLVSVSFVRHHTCNFVWREQSQRTFGNRDSGFAGAASRREGVGRLLRTDVDARHGKVRALTQLIDHVVQLATRARRVGEDFDAAHAGDGDLVAEEPGNDVHDAAQRDGDEHARLAVHAADEDEQAHHAQHEEERLGCVDEACHGLC
jgi:hypothetical protein